MNQKQVDKYLKDLEIQLLESKKEKIVFTKRWADQFPLDAGVYVFYESGQVCYVGESGSIRGRMKELRDTRNHVIRKNIAKLNFSSHPKYVKVDSSTKFPEELEELLIAWMIEKLEVSFLILKLGRKEIEEKLIEAYKPKYNIKKKRAEKKNRMEKMVENLKDINL